jgi:4-hydroxy-tetrahydrodipicolinate reductase
VHRDPPAEPVEGVPVEPAEELGALLAEREPDAMVDFTGPESSVRYVEASAEAGVPAVVGTTGFDDGQSARLEAAADDVPVLRAANFARGVQALLRAVREAVRDLPGYDVEVTETHHNAKRDAPSGTAGELLDAIEAERGGDSQRVHGREGDAPRMEGEVGVHARRAGDVTGEHEVLLAGNHEVLTLTHRAESRGVFAAGALDAAAWLRERDPGFYDFGDVLGEP